MSETFRLEDLGVYRPGGAGANGRHDRDRGRDPDRALREVLDLHLDAMMISLAAAGRAGTGSGGSAGVGVPWRRWLAENLDLALVLAAVVVREGKGASGTAPADPLGALASRYESITDRLFRSLEDPGPERDPGWRATMATTLHRCVVRLEEIRAQRRLAAGLRPVIPGEFLG